MKKRSPIDSILDAARTVPPVPSLARAADERALRAAADAIANVAADEETMSRAEGHLLSSGPPLPVGQILAIKLARSLAAAERFDRPITLHVVFAMFRERNRLYPPARLNPHGEDLLRNKIGQLEHLFARSDADWTLTAVDDGCPEASGRLAREIVNDSFPHYADARKVEVLFLEEAIAGGEPEAAGISDVAMSTKGGSILYGLRKCAARSAAGDVLLFTDADLSTHLGQAGLLIAPIVKGDADVVAGSRREPDSAQIKSAARSSRGRLFIHLWKRMLPLLADVIDSQAAFKAFRADSTRPVLAAAGEIGFAIDIELLLLAEIHGLKIAKGGICWIDSEIESSTTGQETHLAMLKSVAEFRRRHLPLSTPGGEIAAMIESFTLSEWNDLLENPPEALLAVPLDRLGDPALL